MVTTCEALWRTAYSCVRKMSQKLASPCSSHMAFLTTHTVSLHCETLSFPGTSPASIRCHFTCHTLGVRHTNRVMASTLLCCRSVASHKQFPPSFVIVYLPVVHVSSSLALFTFCSVHVLLLSVVFSLDTRCCQCCALRLCPFFPLCSSFA